MADEIGVQVQADGTALNLYEDGTAGVPEDVRKAAEELFDPDSDPVISQDDNPSYNPGKPGRTYDEMFKPDPSAPRFYADVTDSITLVIEWDEGWHLWQIDKLKMASHLDAAGQGHQHIVGPLESFLDAQDAAVCAIDRILDEQAEAGASDAVTVQQTFNIGEDDEADVLVMYGVPRHALNDPAALRNHLLGLYAKQHRAWTALAKLYPLAKTRADELSAFEGAAKADAEDGRRSGGRRDQARKNALTFRAKLDRFGAAEQALIDLGVPLSDRE
jgi:hypothetical protein